MKNLVCKTFICLSLALVVCSSFYSCKKNLTIEERKKELENVITKEDCREITIKSLQAILTNMKDIQYKIVSNEVQENSNFLSDDRLYVQILVSGSVKGELNGKDSLYYFYLYGRIPEKLADKKEFDEDGYNISLKNSNGMFVYSNKENVDSLNNEKIISKKRIEEFERKKSEISVAKVEEALLNEWKSSNQSSLIGAKECYINDVRIDEIKDNVIYVSYTLMSKYDSDNIKTVKMDGAKLSKDKNYYKVLSVGIN